MPSPPYRVDLPHIHRKVSGPQVSIVQVAILLEVKPQQMGNEIAMKMDFDAFWIMRSQMQGKVKRPKRLISSKIKRPPNAAPR
jgi:hypothetical protein